MHIDHLQWVMLSVDKEGKVPWDTPTWLIPWHDAYICMKTGNFTKLSSVEQKQVQVWWKQIRLCTTRYN